MIGLACGPQRSSPKPFGPVSSVPTFAAQKLEHAAKHPDDPIAARRAAFALGRAALEGQTGLFPVAEQALWAAYRRNPGDDATARYLGRFLNIHLTEGDFTQTGAQNRLYAELLVRRGHATSPQLHVPAETFELQVFCRMAAVAHQVDQGHNLQAWTELRQLEQTMERRIAAYPHETTSHAMLGNYELAIGQFLKLGRRARLDRAITHLEYQQRHWESQPVTTRGMGTAPGTRSVFAFLLAEAELARGRAHDASRNYRRVIDESGRDDATPAMQQLARWSEHRIEHLEDYRGSMQLLPAWPNGRVSCTACHSDRATLSEADLWRLHSR